MGADLIGYMVIAPYKITKAMQQRALKYLGVLKTLAADEYHNAEINNFDIDEKWNTKTIDTQLRIIIEDKLDDIWNGDLVEAIDEFRSMDPKTLVKELAIFINKPQARDTVSRNVSKEECCIFAGDFSWGDEPDGHGYGQLKKIMKYGLDKIWGIH